MSSEKPLSEKPAGYLLATAGGLLGGPVGLITSPGVLFVLNKTLKPKNGSSPKRFLYWALIGIVGAPLSLAPLMGSINNQSVSSPNADTSAQISNPITSAPRSGVNLANFNRLEDGMSYSEVVSILGSDGELMSSNNIGGYKTVMYKWDGTGGFGANMNAMFQNDRLMSKAQFGLK